MRDYLKEFSGDVIGVFLVENDRFINELIVKIIVNIYDN